MIKPNPFTPQSGWEPKSFQGRQNNFAHFVKIINDVLVTKKANHMVILGQWGIGKTSLLKQFKKFAQQKGILASYCPIPKYTEKDTSSDVINIIIEEILKGFPVIKGFDKMIEEIEGAGISVAGFGGQVTRKKRTLPPQILLSDLLLKLWKHLETKLAIILIDDIQNFSEIPQVLDILRLVLSRDEIINKTNYLFVLSSTPQGWHTFIDKHDPIGRFFRKREIIELLNKNETQKVINDTLKGSGVKFSPEIISLIYNYTLGHPYELQLLCSNLYDSQIKGLVSKRQWNKTFKTTLADLSEDYFDSLYRKVADREEPILKILCKSKFEQDIKSIQHLIRKIDTKYPINDVRFYIYRLINKGIIKSRHKGKYQIIDSMFKEYLLLNM